MRGLTITGLLGVVLLAGTPGTTQEPAKIEATVVKYAGLKEAVLKHRGKVVLIDFWGTY